MYCARCNRQTNTRFCEICGSVTTPSLPQAQNQALPQQPVGQGVAYRSAGFNTPGAPAAQPPTIQQPVQPGGAYRSANFNQTQQVPRPAVAYQPPVAAKKDRSPISAFFVTMGGLAAIAIIVFVIYTVVGNIRPPAPEVPNEPGLLETEGPNNYIPSEGWTPSIPVDMTDNYLSDIDDTDIVGKTEAFSITLSSGHYISGVDFPVGSYMVYAVEGYGNFSSNDYGGRGYINQLLGKGSGVPASYKAEAGEVFFPKGTLISFDGLTVRMESGAADVKNQQHRAEPVGKAVTLTAGTYIGDMDFEPGVYDIVVVSGSGSVVSSNETAGISNIMSANPGGSHQISVYYNVILAEYTTLTVGEGLTIKLVPSTGSDYA